MMALQPYDPSKGELMKLLMDTSEHIAREGLFAYYAERLHYPKPDGHMMAVYKATEVEELLQEIKLFMRKAASTPALHDEAQRLTEKIGLKGDGGVPE